VLTITGLGTEETIASGRQRFHGRAGHTSIGVSDVIDLPFVSSKEKDSVFDNGAAGAATVLLQGSRELGIGDGIEIVSRIHDTVTAEGERGAMNLVGAGLQADIDNRTGLPPKFCRRVFFHVEFLD